MPKTAPCLLKHQRHVDTELLKKGRDDAQKNDPSLSDAAAMALSAKRLLAAFQADEKTLSAHIIAHYQAGLPKLKSPEPALVPAAKALETPARSKAPSIDQVIAWLPERAKALMAEGHLKVVADSSALPFSAPLTLEGVYDSEADCIYLMASQLTQASVKPVLKHELYHRAEATDPGLKKAMKTFDKAMQARFNRAAKGLGSVIEKNAYQRVYEAHSDPDQQLAEFKAYLVTLYSQAPESLSAALAQLIRDFIAALRAALLRAGVPLKALSPADLAALADYGLRTGRTSPNDPLGGGSATKSFSSKSISLAS